MTEFEPETPPVFQLNLKNPMKIQYMTNSIRSELSHTVKILVYETLTNYRDFSIDTGIVPFNITDYATSLGFVEPPLASFAPVVVERSTCRWPVRKQTLLFNIFINDMLMLVNECEVCNYADDTSIYATNSDPIKVLSALEYDASLLIKWFHDNHMKLNEDKCNFLALGKNENENQSSVAVGLSQIKSSDSIIVRCYSGLKA